MLIAGVDEVGRGALAGPVTAAAVILNSNLKIEGLKDSKSLSVKKRKNLNKEIKNNSVDWSIASVDSKKIDSINILQASLLAMEKAIKGLSKTPDMVIIDGQFSLDIAIPSFAIIKGDTKYQNIMAASILAKVSRDKLMEKFGRKYPKYGFELHKGYPTKSHINKIKLVGPCAEHRLTFKPVRCIINKKF